MLVAEAAWAVVLIGRTIIVIVDSSSVVIATYVAISHPVSAVIFSAVEEISSVVPTSSAIHSPAVGSIVDTIETWSSKVIVVAAWVAGINAKSPVA